MLSIRENYCVYVAAMPIDMNKSIDGLTILIVDHFNCDPHAQNIFVFRNRTCDKVKILFWDRNGFVIYYKRLEKGHFRFPKLPDVNNYEITNEQLNWLIAGLDFHTMSLYPEFKFDNYF